MKAKSSNWTKFTGRDIAIPGSEMYDTLENLGIEEEEYSFYGQGVNDQRGHDEISEEKTASTYHWYIMTQKGNHKKQSGRTSTLFIRR